MWSNAPIRMWRRRRRGNDSAVKVGLRFGVLSCLCSLSWTPERNVAALFPREDLTLFFSSLSA